MTTRTCYLPETFIVFFFFICQNLSAQTPHYKLTLDYAIHVLSLESPSARLEKLNYKNDILEFENYQKEQWPSISFSFNPVSLNRSIRVLQNPADGSYSYVNDYSNNSGLGLSVSQKIGFTGGQLNVGSDLNYLNEFSQKRHSFSTTPFTIGYSQQLWGGAKLHKREKKIEQQKNLIVIKRYCSKICQIQNEVLDLFMNAVQNRLESELSGMNCRVNDSLLYISKMKLEHGNITAYDYKQIELQTLNNQYEFDNSMKKYEESKWRLFAFLGIEPDTSRIIIPDFDMPLFLDIDWILSYVRNNNIFYTEKQIEEMNAEKNLFLTRMNSHFNGNIHINYGMNQYADNFVDAYRNSNTRGAVSIGFDIPVFQWGVNRNNLRMAENSYDATLLTIEKSVNDFENDIREKIIAYNHSVNLRVTAEKAYALSREQYQILVHKFYLERVSIFELINVQKEQNDAMKRYYDAIKNVYINYYSLRCLTLYDFIKDRELEHVLLNDQKTGN